MLDLAIKYKVHDQRELIKVKKNTLCEVLWESLPNSTLMIVYLFWN